MAFEIPDFKIGVLNANADLSTKQYCAVKLANNAGVAEVALAAVAGEPIIGILQNKPVSGAAAEVMITGVSKAVAGAAITAGAKVMVQVTTGKIITAATTGSTIIGFALETVANADEIVSVLLHPAMGIV